jgi:alpha-tubulin suppressor-like RCC1 family protein
MAPNPPSPNNPAGRVWSLSPSKPRRMLSNSAATEQIDHDGEEIMVGLHDSADPSCSIAMNKVESLLATPRGDLLVCRDRYSALPYLEESERDGEACDRLESPRKWCDNDVFQDANLCNPCADAAGHTGSSTEETTVFYLQDEGGLKGGAPDTTNLTNQQNVGLLGGAVPMDQPETEDEPIIFDAPTRKTVSGPDLYSLSWLPSFDHSEYDSTNAMSPKRESLQVTSPTLKGRAGPKKDSSLSKMLPPASSHVENIKVIVLPATKEEKLMAGPIQVPHVLHGVPTFLQALSQIQIKQISANPLGSHVLMISSDALLFAYGQNGHGQLGIGIKSSPRDNFGFITAPTIVTSLLEHGGKALTCAAGVNHSLVVVKTEGRRVGRLQSRHQLSRPRDTPTNQGSISMNQETSSPSRIVPEEGLTEDDAEDTERTVYIHQLYGFGKNDCMKLGLLNPPQPGEGEDVLLPKRVALQCQVWPDSAGGGIFSIAAGEFHSAALISRPTGAVELYTWGDATHGALGLSSFDSNDHNSLLAPRVLAIPAIVESLSYQPLYAKGEDGQPPLTGRLTTPVFPTVGHSILSTAGSRPEVPVQVALGRNSTFVVTSIGRCMSFGNSLFGLLGHGKRSTVIHSPTPIPFPPNGENPARIKSVSIGAKHALAIGVDGQVYQWGTDPVTEIAECHPQTIDCSGVVTACAGYDSSILVKQDGKTMSFGKGSGRLGLGEGHSDQKQPAPLFGGLHLWR